MRVNSEEVIVNSEEVMVDKSGKPEKGGRTGGL
jgi:hypothetical protein